MPMDEADIKKTAFSVGSPSLYEFTQMPFSLTNSGSSFFCLKEMCLGDQQFLTLLLCCNYITASIDEMLDHIEMVFMWLKDFNLKIRLKNVISFNVTSFSLGIYYLQMVYLQICKRWIK